MHRLRRTAPAFVIALVFILSANFSAAQSADRDRIQAFLQVTGFDVALDSISLSAGSAPQMLGLPPGTFGSDWTRLTEEVFDHDLMRDMALNILEQTLETDKLNHAVAFYASDLGQRLVESENASHLVEDDESKGAEGRALISEMVRQGANRLEIIKQMGAAIDSTSSGVRAVQEIQYRFLLAASAAGVVDLQVDADELRAMLEAQAGPLRLALQENALANAAYTYQAFSDEDLQSYVTALEHPDMQNVYELLNAVQYEIMANRFEVLATRMAELHPGQDI